MFLFKQKFVLKKKFDKLSSVLHQNCYFNGICTLLSSYLYNKDVFFFSIQSFNVNDLYSLILVFNRKDYLAEKKH